MLLSGSNQIIQKNRLESAIKETSTWASSFLTKEPLGIEK